MRVVRGCDDAGNVCGPGACLGWCGHVQQCVQRGVIQDVGRNVDACGFFACVAIYDQGDDVHDHHNVKTGISGYGDNVDTCIGDATFVNW